jgi:predicted DNA-binding transcriptional regulator AlpA
MSDDPSITPLLLDGPGVTAQLSIGLNKFHGMIRSGRFPVQPIRLGKSVRYRAADVAEWVSAGCPNSTKWQAMRAGKAGAA